MWGVDQPATVAVPDGRVFGNVLFSFEFNNESYLIYRHPALFVHQDVLAWYESYEAVSSKFFEKGIFQDQTPLWMDCYRLYDKYYNRFCEALRKNGK